ncbi:MAG: DNA polymerase III subunit beta [Saprospiraceae bacterium]|nr:DNA polymerase III subunit beta [Saprospiraceae bacterium]
MKFNVSSGGFLEKLNIAASALASNPVLPILEDFLIRSDKNKLFITASNLELTISTSLDAEVTNAGSIAIPGKTLLETLKAMPEQPLSIEINDDTRGVTITSLSGVYKLVGEKAEDYPKIAEPVDEPGFGISSEKLQLAIDRTSFATSNDEMRPAMKGICLNIDFNQLTFAATDAHKLVKYSFQDISSDTSATIVLTKKSMLALKTILPKEDKVMMHFNRERAFFSFGDTQLSMRLIEAKYPDYNAVIPVNNPYLLQVSRYELLSALKRIIVYANKSTNQVMLNIQDKSLTISSQDVDLSNEATEQMSCTYQGEPMTIGFSAKYLIEMLSNIGGEVLTIELSSPSKPGIFLPAEQAASENLLMLIMPVMSNY